VSKNFASVIVCDFEYEVSAGDLPDPLCMVAFVLDEGLRHVRTVRLWRGEFGAAPPFDVSPNSLFVAYSAWAEVTCFKALGWRFPVHVFDQHTAYLATSNVLLPYHPNELKKKPRKRLLMPAAPMVSRVGNASTRRRSPKRSVMARGAANTLRRRLSIIAKKMCEWRLGYCTRNCVLSGIRVGVSYFQPQMSSECCGGQTTAPKRLR
jgi:hypothetical protein